MGRLAAAPGREAPGSIAQFDTCAFRVPPAASVLHPLCGRAMERLLVFNCHEAWVHQLEAAPYAIDIVIGLRGRSCLTWDDRARPLPTNARLVTLDEVHRARVPYACIVAHNMSDLLEVRTLGAPRLLVLHATLEGRLVEEGSALTADEIRQATAAYLQAVGGVAVAVSAMKAGSWGQPGLVLEPGIDVRSYPVADGALARGLRVANHVAARRTILAWNVHETAFGGVPVTLVGHNPGWRHAEPARDWAHLKRIYGAHRFLIHTVDERLEDGYNLAVLEGMASGLPVLGTPHDSSPVVHGESGWLTADASELRRFARRLLDDPALALEMGAAARRTVATRFPVARFVERFVFHVERAKRARLQAAGARVRPVLQAS